MDVFFSKHVFWTSFYGSVWISFHGVSVFPVFFWDQIYMLKTEKLRNHGMVDVFSWTEADGT